MIALLRRIPAWIGLPVLVAIAAVILWWWVR